MRRAGPKSSTPSALHGVARYAEDGHQEMRSAENAVVGIGTDEADARVITGPFAQQQGGQMARDGRQTLAVAKVDRLR